MVPQWNNGIVAMLCRESERDSKRIFSEQAQKGNIGGGVEEARAQPPREPVIDNLHHRWVDPIRKPISIAQEKRRFHLSKGIATGNTRWRLSNCGDCCDSMVLQLIICDLKKMRTEIRVGCEQGRPQDSNRAFCWFYRTKIIWCCCISYDTTSRRRGGKRDVETCSCPQ